MVENLAMSYSIPGGLGEDNSKLSDFDAIFVTSCCWGKTFVILRIYIDYTPIAEKH